MSLIACFYSYVAYFERLSAWASVDLNIFARIFFEYFEYFFVYPRILFEIHLFLSEMNFLTMCTQS